MFKAAGEIAQDVLKRTPDPRHARVRKVIAESYTAANGLTVPWDGHTARTLATFLEANKTWSAQALTDCVRNRFASENINPAEDPIRWIRRLPNYARGPLDRFGKPKQAARKTQDQLITEYWERRRRELEG
jgi:hypothetical protein